MKNIILYYGPKKGFLKELPLEIITLSELVTALDSKRNSLKLISEDSDNEILGNKTNKITLANVVAYSDQYSMITEGALQSFLSIFDCFDVQNLYLQNPPEQIKKQLQQSFSKTITEKYFTYYGLTESKFLRINDEFDKNIIGQKNVKDQLLVALYPLLKKTTKKKPLVLMFYGKSGIGKTETAKFISSILKQPIFRKQFSMFHSGEFQNYIFGGSHSQASFARDLLERESNVILLDEFDKPHPIFYSAFYQLFDEGIYEDKNYRLSLHNSIIICTSNYTNESEIRASLGDPLFYRFDKFIKFEDLSTEAIYEIIDLQIQNKYEKLNFREKEIIDKNHISMKIKSVTNKIHNARHISKLVDEYISMTLVDALIENRQRNHSDE